MKLRIDPAQRFTCHSCGRCCRRWDVVVTDSERTAYQKRNVAQWFREADSPTGGTARDPFEPIAGVPGYFRIRTRSDGACGFLSDANRCRIHEELGSAAKPLTCRMFPFKFNPSPGAVVVTASFGCPTIAGNRGEPVAEGTQRAALDRLGDEWSQSTPHATTGSRWLVAGRAIDGPSLRIVRESLLRMLAGAGPTAIDLRANLQRMAQALDDLTRSRVLGLPDDDFAEYIRLTLPYAASATTPVAPQPPARIGRLMQFGFLYVVAATRYGIEHRHDSPWSMRLARLRMLAHFHRLAPAMGRVSVGALRRHRVDINAPEIQPVVYHYVRATIESLGAQPRPVLDDFAIAVSCLNAACSLAAMNAAASGRAIDRHTFSDALMESVDVLHADDRGLLGWALPRLAAQVEALRMLSAPLAER